MPGRIDDIQFGTLTVTNDANEQTVYAVNVPGGSITTTNRYQVLMAGTLSSALVPGNFTIKVKLGSASVTVASEALAVLASNARFSCNFEVWLRADNVVALSGFIAQNASDVFLNAGARLNSGASALNLTVDQMLSVTVQFSTADPANSFMRSLAALFILTG